MKRTRQPIRRETEARTRSGLLSLFWMFIGAVIAVMIGLFLYLSPLFDSFRKEVDVNPPATITPLPQEQESVGAGEYEFYEILPKREFRSDETSLSDNATPAVNPNTAPATISPEDDVNITIVEENTTYEEFTPTTNNPPTKEIPSEPQGNHFIRIKADSPDEADRIVGQLMLIGISAKVETMYNDRTDEQLYYIISEKMTPSHAKEAYQLVHQNGIDALLIEDVRP